MSIPIILTGFEPFGEHQVNASWEIVNQVGSQFPELVYAHRLPVEYLPARNQLYKILMNMEPFICLCVGLGGKDTLAFETRARKPGQFYDIEGKALHYGTWPVEEAINAVSEIGLPIIISEDAGQYVCESTYWSLLQFQEANGFPLNSAFLHVPQLSARFTSDLLTRAIRKIVFTRLNKINHDCSTTDEIA